MAQEHGRRARPGGPARSGRYWFRFTRRAGSGRVCVTFCVTLERPVDLIQAALVDGVGLFNRAAEVWWALLAIAELTIKNPARALRARLARCPGELPKDSAVLSLG
jgi:hypothetical protein